MRTSVTVASASQKFATVKCVTHQRVTENFSLSQLSHREYGEMTPKSGVFGKTNAMGCDSCDSDQKTHLSRCCVRTFYCRKILRHVCDSESGVMR
jgi:hypothetical protein